MTDKEKDKMFTAFAAIAVGIVMVIVAGFAIIQDARTQQAHDLEQSYNAGYYDGYVVGSENCLEAHRNAWGD